MKKLLLSAFAACAATASFAQTQCNDLFFSEYAEGSNNNKAIEIYNPTNAPISMANKYRMIRYNNGTTAAAGEANSQAIINLGSHVIAAHDVWVIVIDKRDASAPCPGQECAVSPALQAVADTFLSPDYNVNYTMYFNGNDALSLQKSNDGGMTWQYVDIFGKMGDPAMVSGYGWSDVFPYDGSAPGSVEWTENHTLVRKSSVKDGVTANPTDFIVNTQWDSLPNQTWTGLGTHICECALASVEETASVPVKVFPNPAEGGMINVSTTETIRQVEIFNVVGQLASTATPSTRATAATVSTAGLQPGIYFVKLTFEDNRTSTVKVSVK